ncbi:MAG: acetate--CoA ligase family protein [Hyphomicrobiales bacterium]
MSAALRSSATKNLGVERATWLEPMLSPRSIAIVGASDRVGSFGRSTLEQTIACGFAGEIFPVNPRLSEVHGLQCYPSLADLPHPADLAVLVVANDVLEPQLELVARTGCRSAVIFASGYLENDTQPPLTERLAAIARTHGLPLCGANCMGYVRPAVATHATWYKAGALPAGNVGFISHSGSIFLTLSSNDPRFALSLAVSPGQELVVSAADYLHFMLEDEHTRAIALFLETVRDPEGFSTALERAREKDVPIVALKIGRTEKSALLAKSHSGALAGNDAAYEALFDRHGVIRVRTIDELASTTMLMAQPRRAVQGGLGAVLDSGGARGLFLDLAHDNGIRFAEISAATEVRLRNTLEYGLEPVNPVDAWGTGNNAGAIFEECLQAVADDPDTGLAILMSDITNDDDPANAEFAKLVRTVQARSHKPIVLGLHWSQHRSKRVSRSTAEAGIPVLDGVESALLAIKHAFDYRDFRLLPSQILPNSPDATVVSRWRRRLGEGRELDETESLALLSDYAIPVPCSEVVTTADQAAVAAERIGWPVVLKTAMPGIRHKSDVGGVRLNIGSVKDLHAAFGDMAGRLGPRAVIGAMASKGVELALGIVRDEQFGPVVLISAGGTLIEVLHDRQAALPPFDEIWARRLLDRLTLRKLLDGHRGEPPADIASLVAVIARFSLLARDLGDLIAEMDVNPLIVSTHGVTAVDALTIPIAEST